MFHGKYKKIIALALCGMIGAGAFGLAAGSAEAARHSSHYQEVRHSSDYDRDYEREHDRDKRHWDEENHRDSGEHRKKYSEGERNTAAILGAVVGAVVAKNT